MDFASGLAGLALLSGDSTIFSALGTAATTVDSRAVRAAKGQFTLQPTTPPWSFKAATTPLPVQVSAIQAMRSIIDKPETGTRTLPGDVQTAFTSWKALDRLRLLAETAAANGTGSSTRAQLQTSFAKGLAGLQDYLATAPSDKLDLAFAQPAHRAETVALTPGTTNVTVNISGKGVVANRDQILSGLSGTEQFRVRLARGSAVDSVVVDLASLPEPPTLDSIAALINQAIAMVPMRDTSGQPVLAADRSVEPKWKAAFVAHKGTDGWGLQLNRQSSESVSIEQVGAPDALVVATGQTALEAPTVARVMRLDDPAGAMTQHRLASFAATDRIDGTAAATTSDAMATDAQGFAYVLGTASGNIGLLRPGGMQDLMLTKMDSLGNVVWQRGLGAAASAAGAGISIAPDGAVVVAATVTGSFDGAQSDGDMLVARFAANGDEDFSRLVRGAGADRATSIVTAGDGSIYLAGRAASGGGDGFVARLDAQGHVLQRRSFDSGGADQIGALAMAADGRVLALSQQAGQSRLLFLDGETLAAQGAGIDLGAADARAIAVGTDGRIAIGGATLAALPGAQVNAPTAQRDGFVATLDADGGNMAVSYIGSSGSDGVDSLVFANGALYAGGRTTGTLGAARTGATDGFVARIDPITGAVGTIQQFGQPTQRTEPVRLAVSAGGQNKVSELGFGRGAITPDGSLRLTTGTSLRAGDSFSLRVNGGTERKITIAADDTLASLAERVRRVTGKSALVTTPRTGDTALLRIVPASNMDIEFIAGPTGTDALAKLGLPHARVTGSEKIAKNAPVVRPGGAYGLNLDLALSIGDKKSAAAALGRIKSALSMAQTAYRSLYWDDTKANRVNGAANKGTGTAVQQAQLANYQAALTRLSATSTDSGSGIIGL